MESAEGVITVVLMQVTWVGAGGRDTRSSVRAKSASTDMAWQQQRENGGLRRFVQNNRQKRMCWIGKASQEHETSGKEAVPSLQNLVAIAKRRNKLLQHLQSEALERLAVDFVGQKGRDIFLKADRGEPVCNLLHSPFRGIGTCKVANQRIKRHEQHSLLEGTPFPVVLGWV